MFMTFGVFVVFMGHWSWSLVAFFYSVSSVYGALGLEVCGVLQLLWHLWGLALYVRHLCGV